MFFGKGELKYTLWAIALTAVISANDECLAQGLVFDLGWYGGIDTSSLSVYPEQKSTNGLPWSLAFYFGRLMSGERFLQFGFIYTRQAVDIDRKFPDQENMGRKDGYIFRRTSFMMAFQWFAYRRTWGGVIAEFATGVALIEDIQKGSASCDSFCIPSIGWRTAPAVTLLRKIHADFGLQATLRRDVKMYHEYPFSPGTYLGVGVLFEPK